MAGGSFSKERSQFRFMCQPSVATAINLTDAAATVELFFIIPSNWYNAAQEGNPTLPTAYAPSIGNPVILRNFGMIAAAAGGAQTTAGTLQLQRTPLTTNTASIQIAGQASATTFTDTATVAAAVGSATAATAGSSILASVVSHIKGTAVEKDLNATVAGSSGSPVTTAQPDTFNTPPAYPIAFPGDLLTAVIGTQGVGAGDQTHFPYLLVSVAYP
jgi:hypothetical protein